MFLALRFGLTLVETWPKKCWHSVTEFQYDPSLFLNSAALLLLCPLIEHELENTLKQHHWREPNTYWYSERFLVWRWSMDILSIDFLQTFTLLTLRTTRITTSYLNKTWYVHWTLFNIHENKKTLITSGALSIAQLTKHLNDVAFVMNRNLVCLRRASESKYYVKRVEALIGFVWGTWKLTTESSDPH